jgi:hypothetical protein
MKKVRILITALTSIALVSAMGANSALGILKALRPNW